MKYQHRVVALLSLLAIITYLDRVCITVAGPRMQDNLHISPQAWGWVTSLFFISYAAFEIPTGALGDRNGPRRVLTRIVTWWSAFTSLTGIVSSYPLLLLVRFCFDGDQSLDPEAEARTHLGDHLDDQPDRRSDRAAASSTDTSALRLARIVLLFRDPRRNMEPGLVRMVSGFAARDERHHCG